MQAHKHLPPAAAGFTAKTRLWVRMSILDLLLFDRLLLQTLFLLSMSIILST
jgi:hypothetical protein